METLYTSLDLCERNPSVTHGFLTQRAVMRRFVVFFVVSFFLNIGRWFKTPWHSYDITVMDGVVRKTSGYSFDGRNEVLWM